MSEKKTQLYILTGFLGSGKTTLLLKILDNLKGEKVGVIQNESGKLSIDGDRLRSGDIEMVEITQGAIFCNCRRLNFVEAMVDLAGRGMEYLFVESTGIGDPSNVLEIISAAKEAGNVDFDYCGSICMVDAVNFADQLANHEEASRQVKHCQLAVITKTDLSNAEETASIIEKIRALNPRCEIQTAVMGDMDMSFVHEDLLSKFGHAETEATTNGPETKPKTFFINFEGETDKEALKSFLEMIAPQTFRAKGSVLIAGEGWTQVDLVGKTVDFKAAEPREIPQMIIISKVGAGLIKNIMEAQKKTGLAMKLKN